MNLSFLSSWTFCLSLVALAIIAVLLACARRADGSPYIHLDLPTLLLQILYPDSRKCGFGWALFLVATFAAFYLKKASGEPMLDAEKWLLCSGAASALMGFGTFFDKKHELELAKLDAAKGGAPDAAPAPAA